MNMLNFILQQFYYINDKDASVQEFFELVSFGYFVEKSDKTLSNNDALDFLRGATLVRN